MSMDKLGRLRDRTRESSSLSLKLGEARLRSKDAGLTDLFVGE